MSQSYIYDLSDGGKINICHSFKDDRWYFYDGWSVQVSDADGKIFISTFGQDRELSFQAAQGKLELGIKKAEDNIALARVALLQIKNDRREN